MSEVPTNINIPPTDPGNLPPDPNLLTPPPVEKERASRELLASARDHALVAVHGIRGAVANRRMERAGKRMERMDHKLALYEHLGGITINGTIDTTERDPVNEAMVTPRPRTFIERHMDKKLNDRVRKHQEKEIYRNRTVANSGGERTNTFGKKSGLMTSLRKHEINKAYRAGNLSAAERHTQLLTANARPLPAQTFETGRQRQTRKQLERANRKLHALSITPAAQIYRLDRKLGAIDTIKTQHARAEKHAARLENVQMRQQIRKVARAQRKADKANQNNP